MELKRAGEMMIPLDEYLCIPYWFTLRQAMAEMEKAEVVKDGRAHPPRFMLIFNEKSELLGTVRRRDILRGLEPEFLTGLLMDVRKKLFDVKVDPKLSKVPTDKLWKGIEEQAERPVSDVMRLVKTTVDYEDHIIKIIYEMVDNNISLLPVLKDKEVVGVVRTEEVFHEMARLLVKEVNKI